VTARPTLVVAAEVAEAIGSGQAVVALESTIISHGMPYPTNVQMAREVEAIVRANGAVPATIAVLDGRCHVGLDDAQLEQLATAEGVVKATTRDLPWLVATDSTGATTVAATMRLAALAGIKVFATGGIGGVHRGAATTMDVSADLTGRLDTPSAIAAHLHATWDVLGLTTGVSIANPIPVTDEIPAHEIGRVIDEALAELDEFGIVGQDVTPFLLAKVVERTEGRSLTANLALVRHNAAVAAQVAVAYTALLGA
jgi:pseudouridine-5'-phosphate glycosidase